MSLVFCTDTILNEIRQGVTNSSLASSYAMAIVSESRKHDKPDWRQINAAISARFGTRGLERIKSRAWKIIRGGKP